MTLVASGAPGSATGTRSTTVVAPFGCGPDTLAAAMTGGAAATAVATAGRRADGPIRVASRSSTGAISGSPGPVSGRGSGRRSWVAAPTRALPRAAASSRSAGSRRPAPATIGASGPSSSGTSSEWSSRAMSVPMVVSAVNGTSPVTDSTMTSASE
jgi:hypothetical protein